jgi:IPT/TIG domain
VGGTTLVADGSTRGWTETAWSGAGSGCSQYEPRPSWQAANPNISSTCHNHADADVSAVADPDTPVFAYDSAKRGWSDVGGTSVASPIVASAYALTASASTYSPSYLYSHASGLNDVTSGSNGSCGGTDLCNAGAGWDGPTGLGTPDGISAFGIGPSAVISSVTPATGPTAGGQAVTVRGSGFKSGMTATIGGAPLTPASVTFNSFTFTTPADTAGYVQIQVTTSVGASQLTAAAGYIYVGLGNYTPLAPFRILDTRSGHGDPLGPGAARTLRVTGVGSPPIPADAGAAVLNVTEVDGTAGSLLTVYPTGTLRPNASNLNFAAGTVTANLVTATLGQGGSVSIYNALGTVNVLVDVEGYFEPPDTATPLGEFHPISPLRVCDTRSARTPTPCSVHGQLVGGTPMVVNVTGSATTSIPNDGTAEAAVLNVTGVSGTLATYISVFPTTTSGSCAYNASHPPSISTLNLTAAAVDANRVMVELGPEAQGGPDTSVCVYAAVGKINVILDANGWYGSATALAGTGAQYEAIAPSRICDTRVASTGCTTGAIGAKVSRLIGVTGHGGVPDVGGSNPVIVAVIANLTAIAPSQATYLTLFPSDPSTQTPPLASDLNVNAGETLPNLAVVQLDTAADANDGSMSLFNPIGSINAAVDLEGWFQ